MHDACFYYHFFMFMFDQAFHSPIRNPSKYVKPNFIFMNYIRKRIERKKNPFQSGSLKVTHN